MKAFDKQNYQLATKLGELRKGQLCYVEGKLTLEQWTAQDGQKRSKHVLLVDRFVLLERRERQQEPRQEPEYQAAPVDKDIPF